MLTKRQKLLAAVFGSAFVHAVLLFGVGVIMAMHPSDATIPTPQPIRLEVVKSDPLTPEAAPTPSHRVIDNSDMKEADHPPLDTKLEGDKDTRAASEGPPTGDKPLPTQVGREAPVYVFNPTPPTPPALPAAAPPAPTELPVTAPPPPAPVRVAERIPAERPAPTRVRNELAMLDTQPTPAPEELNPYDPSFRSTAPPPPVAVKRPAQSAYRPKELQTASSGNITTRGAASVDAASTPFGRYQKAVLDSIRVVWTQEVHARSDVTSLGSVKFHFAVDRTGHVHTPRVLSNSSTEALAAITLDAITSAPIPPIPPEVVDSMDEAMLQLDVTFECL